MGRNGYGHMVLDHYVAKVRQVDAVRAARLRALATREQALAYQAHVREAIRTALGPLPPKTPLNARTTGSLRRRHYTIEKLIFESRPGLWVTANLYLPHGLDAPAPCVLGTCGHSEEGKAFALYQAFCQRLARQGFVVLIYDPLNQGERDQYALLTDRETVRACTSAHNMMGKQLQLLGENLAMWRAWDGIRALDYLLSRPEVDASRVGLTGNSGGGTMTTWLWPLDERFTMAAPGCFVTTFLHNLENELPADCEQYPPGALGAGLEMADFIIARAPQPVIILGQHYDYFDRRGHRQACEEVRRFYELLGAPVENAACFRGDRAHGYWRENQEAMVRFFARHAGLEVMPPIADEELDILPVEELWATPTGNVVEAGARPIYHLIAQRAEELAAARPPLDGEALRAKLRELLNLPATDPSLLPPHHRNLRPVHRDEVTYARYAIETEGNVRAILRKRMAEAARAHSLDVGRAVCLYLPHYAGEEELADLALSAEFPPGAEIYALDVRGLGESVPDEERPFWHPYGMDYMFHGYGLLLGESYLGRRVWDVLRTLDLLRAEGAQEVHLIGRGQGALLALLAALLHPGVDHVTLLNVPPSYHAWTQVPLVDWPAANGMVGVLQHLDLDDCLRALGERVTCRDPWGPHMEPGA